MLSEREIKQIIENIEHKDSMCTTQMHKKHGTCMDVRHVMHGTMISILKSVLQQDDYLDQYK